MFNYKTILCGSHANRQLKCIGKIAMAQLDCILQSNYLLDWTIYCGTIYAITEIHTECLENSICMHFSGSYWITVQELDHGLLGSHETISVFINI